MAQDEITALHVPGAFTGRIKNSRNIGKTSRDLVELWNKGHSDDLVSPE